MYYLKIRYKLHENPFTGVEVFHVDGRRALQNIKCVFFISLKLSPKNFST